MGKHLGAIEEAVGSWWGGCSHHQGRLEDFTEEFTSFRGAWEGA